MVLCRSGTGGFLNEYQLAQFERRLIQERTRSGLTAARARGRLGGRKAISPNDPRVLTAKAQHADKKMPVADICRPCKSHVRPCTAGWR